MLKITDIDYLHDYSLKIEFNDGVVKIVDLRPHLKGPVFGKLLDKDLFVQYGIVRGTIEWANGLDFAPEFLYKIGETAPETTVHATESDAFSCLTEKSTSLLSLNESG